MRDEELRDLERQAAEGDDEAGHRLRAARRRTDTEIVAHVVQYWPGRGHGVSICDIRIAPAGVSVRGHGGRERAERVIEAAGVKQNMTKRAALGKNLRALEAQGYLVPHLDLYRFWRDTVGEKTGRLTTTDWAAYFRSAAGIAKLRELTPAGKSAGIRDTKKAPTPFPIEEAEWIDNPAGGPEISSIVSVIASSGRSWPSIAPGMTWRVQRHLGDPLAFRATTLELSALGVADHEFPEFVFGTGTRSSRRSA